MAHDVCDRIMPYVTAGYDAAVLSYGHVDGGKSFRVVGRHDETTFVETVIRTLLEYADDERRIDRSMRHSFKLSVFEVFDNHIRDLLAPFSHDSLKLKEESGAGKRVHVAGVKRTEIYTPEQVSQALDAAYEMQQRVAQSSRGARVNSEHAHRVLELIMSCDVGGAGTHSVSRILFVDLAGSHKPHLVRSEGLRERSAVNTSLLAISSTLHEMATGRKILPLRSNSIVARLLGNQTIKV